MKKYALILALAICVGVGGWFVLHQDTPPVEETTTETINEETPEITADPVDTEETTETETPVEETPVTEDADKYTPTLDELNNDILINFGAAESVMGNNVYMAVGFLKQQIGDLGLECPDNLEDLYKEYIENNTNNSSSGSSSSDSSSSGSSSSNNSSSGSTTTQKPVEQKPVEQKPVEQKPVEQKPVEQKPVEQQPVEQKPAEQPSDNGRPDWLPEGWEWATGSSRPDGLPTDGSGGAYSPDLGSDVTVIG